MLHISSYLGLFHSEEKCSSSLLACSSPHFKSPVMAPQEVLFQLFLPKSGLTGWANIKRKNAKVSFFQLNYTVRRPWGTQRKFWWRNVRPKYVISLLYFIKYICIETHSLHLRTSEVTSRIMGNSWALDMITSSLWLCICERNTVSHNLRNINTPSDPFA